MSKQNIPQLQTMKMEVAREFGVDMNSDYGGNVSSKDNGRVGGEMVRRMVENYQRQHSQMPMQ